MGLNFGNVSKEDKERVKSIRNPPAFDAGDPVDSGADEQGFDELFGGSDGDFGDLDDIFGKDEGEENPFETGSTDGKSGSTNQNGATGFTGANGTGVQQISQVRQPDNFDKAFDFTVEGVKNLIDIIIEMVKSIGTRNADDFGYYSTNLIKTGLIGIGIAVAFVIVSILTKVPFFGINNMSGLLIKSFALTSGTGIICIGLSAIMVASTDKDYSDISELEDAGKSKEDDATNEYEDELGDIMNDLFGESDDTESDDDIFGGEDFSFDPDEDDQEEIKTPVIDKPKTDFSKFKTAINFEDEVNKVRENKILNRNILFETFLNFLPTNNPNFSEKKDISPDNEAFEDIESSCLKALSNVMKCDVEEVGSAVEKITETFFSYEVKMKRVKGFTKLEEFAREIEVYVRDRPSDTGITASVDILGDDFFIVITKGISPIITLGDVFTQSDVVEFFKNEKNKLPIISGITELGEVIYQDAKIFDTMMICGKPRSGKSWYVLSILLNLMMFNTPEDVQFIIVDPKESNLFKTLALMPHVAGLHNGSNILNIMDDLIKNESKRRKDLLSDNKCDDIWALRKKGVKLPVLYLVIDEYITLKNKLAEDKLDKELDNKLQTIISQLPSQGIRLIFIPHRATGIVNKTNRTMLQYTASVKGDTSDIEDTLDIKGWKKPLINPGDIALKTSASQDAKYVRGAAITTSDEDNAELIENIAKAFYKMGVDMPDMSYLQCSVTRDEEYIRERLLGTNRVQFNANNIFDDED